AEACSASRSPSDKSSSSSESGNGGSAMHASSGVGFGGRSCTHCSSDLRQVLDCDEKVVTTCPVDKGCEPVNGTCVESCESARATASVIGCEFFSVIPGQEAEVPGSCFAAMIANTWASPLSIQADYGGQPLDIAKIARKPVGQGKSITYEPLLGG